VFYEKFYELKNRVPRIRENRIPKISEIGSLQVHTGYLTFCLKNTCIKMSNFPAFANLCIVCKSIAVIVKIF